MRIGNAGRFGKTKLGLAVLVASWLCAGAVGARDLGIDTSQMLQAGPVTCSGVGCHAPASPEVFVTITGPAELAADETGDYTIEMFETVPGGLQKGAGVNVSAFLDGILTDLADGILAENDPASQITMGVGIPSFVDTGQLTHFAANPFADGKFSYDFTVTMPNPAGPLELRGAMNSYDGSVTVLGEKWNSTSLLVPEPSTTILSATALIALAVLRRRRRI